MKFTCDSCNAQYMISDDKVGPTGVKVRCKKCGHVITVRQADAAAAAGAAPASSPAAPAPSGDGLDAELGSAFDSAFSEKPAAPAPAPDLDATQAMSPEDAKRIASAGAPAALSTEWYVAIGEAQVGPLPIADVKRKWELGDVGPDSLVWRPGMGDWSPLSTVAELASVLSPIPRPAPRAAAPKPATPALGTPAVAAGGAAPPPSGAAPDATWKPAGASALAALASEELQSRAPAAAPEPAKPAPKPAGAKSLVEQMNLDSGGVEPTGALPLSIKGVERTDEIAPRRKSSVAARQAEVRQKRGAARVVIGAVVAVVAVLAVAGYFGKQYLDQRLPGAVAERPAPPPPAAPPAPPPAAAAPAPAAPAPAPAAPAAAPAVATAEPPPAAPAAPPAPVAAPAPAPAPKAARGAKAPPLPPRVAAAKREPEPPPPPPPPAAKPKGKADSLLDIDGGGDDALQDALGGGGGSGRSVYVPPKPGGTSGLPDTVSDGQVTEGIKGRFDSLAACADKGSGSGATVVIQWDISADGSVRAAKCKAPCGDTGIGTCLAGVVKTIRFPRSAGGRTRVEFPFKF